MSVSVALQEIIFGKLCNTSRSDPIPMDEGKECTSYVNVWMEKVIWFVKYFEYICILLLLHTECMKKRDG